MASTDLADQLSSEVQAKNEDILQLRQQLGEQKSQKSTTALSNTSENGSVQQIVNLQRELSIIRQENDRLIKEAALASDRFQNTLSKLTKVEKDHDEDIQTIKGQMAERNQRIRKLQSSIDSGAATSRKDKQLREELEKKNQELTATKAESSRLKMLNQSLTRQLQVEKSENMKKLAGMRSDSSKGYDQDDEEHLPTDDTMLKTEGKTTFDVTPTRSSSKFKHPKIPQQFLKSLDSLDSLSSQNGKTKPSNTPPKKRKRSTQEQLDEELADLGIGNLEMPTKSRRKEPISYRDRMEDDSDDEDLPHPSTFFRSNKNTQSANKTTTAQPPTPVSPTFSLPRDGQFTFTAVVAYRTSGSVSELYHYEDLKGMTELSERVEIVKNIWEHYKGEDWKWEFVRPGYKPVNPACVTSKCQNKRTRWNLGCEGTHACKDCAAAGRPCFAYVELEKGHMENNEKWDYGEFRLLPLREKDRLKGVQKGKEIRYWVNDGIKLLDHDVMDED